jgi:hypothetical protein
MNASHGTCAQSIPGLKHKCETNLKNVWLQYHATMELRKMHSKLTGKYILCDIHSYQPWKFLVLIYMEHYTWCFNKSISDLIMVLHSDNVQLLSLIHWKVLYVPVAQPKPQKSSDILSKLQMSCRVL